MANYLRIIIAFVLTVVLAIILTPFFGGLYDKFSPPTGEWFWGPSHSEYIPGFIIAYLFFLPLFIISLLEKKKIMWLLIGISPIIFLNLWEVDGVELIMSFILFTTGALLGLLSSKLAKIGEKN